MAISVNDPAGVAVRVSGRGAISGPPATVVIQGVTQQITAWAGPWPVDERWWDAARSRRMARFQLLTETGRLLLTAVEHQQWWLSGEYR
jgi:protein ImuB